MWTGQHVKRWIENNLTKYVNPEDMHKKYKTTSSTEAKVMVFEKLKSDYKDDSEFSNYTDFAYASKKAIN